VEQGDIIKAHCNRCSGERNHFIIHVHEEEWSEDLGDEAFISGKDRYELLKCAGCGDVRLRHTNWFSEHEDERGKPIPTITYYPPASIRREPAWLSSVDVSHGVNVHIVWMPEYVSRLLREVYIALQNDCCSIAAMGIRALLERLMIEHVDDQGSFSANLDAFEKAGYFGGRQREIIETTLEVGHASVHRNYNPTRQDVTQVLDIAENIIQSIYVSAEQAKALKKRIPPRSKHKKTSDD
jgi:hypothetical protein